MSMYVELFSYLCIYIHIYMHISRPIYLSLYMHTYTCIHVCMHMYTHIRHVCIYTSCPLHMHLDTHVYHIYIYTYTHVDMHVRIYTYIANENMLDFVCAPIIAYRQGAACLYRIAYALLKAVAMRTGVSPARLSTLVRDAYANRTNMHDVAYML